MAIARHPGERSKIIVKSQDRRIDPVGACVGMRGSRIQAIVRELNNEKIDIINHSEQPEILISRALSPAKPIDLYIDDERKYCVTLFNDDELEFAIGRGGVNINLASRVTGFRIDAFGKKQYERQQEDQATALADVPDFPKDLVKTLAENNIETVSNLLNADEENLLAIDAVNDKNLEQCYLVVQSFIERVEEEEKEEKIELEKILEEVAATDESATEDNASEEIEEIQKVEPQDTNKAAEVTEEGVDEAEEPVKEDEATVDENVQNEQLEEEVAAEKEEVEEA